MNDYLAKLNPKQLEACKDIIGPSLIVAGAGSGKTAMIGISAYYKIKNGLIDDVTLTPKSRLDL